MPSTRVITGLDFHLPAVGPFLEWGFGAEGRFVWQQKNFPPGIDYADPPPGYQLLDLHFHGELGVAGQLVRMQVGLHNAFNTRYRDYLSRFRYFIDDPGRNITVGLAIPFGQSMEE